MKTENIVSQAMTATAAPRQYYMDILKGIAIYMVVMGHVITLCIRDIDSTLLFKLIAEVHMPLFFFISGWFTFKFRADGTPFRLPDMKHRAMQLLVPMVVVSTIWIYLYPKTGLQIPFDSTWRGLWINTSKNGYWFTPCLFELMVMYCGLAAILRRIPAISGISVILAVWALLFVVSSKYYGKIWWGVVEMEVLVRFFPVFMAGALARRYESRFMALVNRPSAYTTALVAGGFLLYFTCYFGKFGVAYEWVDIARGALHIAIAMIAIPLAASWTQRKGALNSRAVRLWAYLGRESLAIYLLHYLFLFPMWWLQEPLRTTGLGFVPAAVVAGIAAAAIIGCVLAVNVVISRSPLLALLLTGKTSHQPAIDKQCITTI